VEESGMIIIQMGLHNMSENGRSAGDAIVPCSLIQFAGLRSNWYESHITEVLTDVSQFSVV
jgi:hypothetical protein